MSATIQQTIDELRRTLTEYIEATYHIGDPAIVAQRRRLLEEVGGIFQIPYLESTPSYATGRRYADMEGLPEGARLAYTTLADGVGARPVIFDPPYVHQAQAIAEVLQNHRNLMIMTGTGSGKTESFLLPILGKLAIEAREHPNEFREHNAVRAIILYPMNALVNDQLGRLRHLFGNVRTISMFETWAGRPAHFARYTSRTPYSGVRHPSKDSSRLSSIGNFFVAIEDAARRHSEDRPHIPEEDERAFDLLRQLQARGKWPAKESVSAWFGQPHTQWRESGGRGRYRRAVLRPHDAELLTRHEIQECPPDLLITNYSMLEYMMMRPIERPIFDRTREWLAACPDERILVVLDEAHLYRGAQGAEVGLLLRRLRERLDISADRFQVICATASFSEEGRRNAGQFGAQLTGVPASSFVPITGTLALREPHSTGTDEDVDALCAVDLERFYGAAVEYQAAAVRPFLDFRSVPVDGDSANLLHRSLSGYGPFNHLVNETMSTAIPLRELGSMIFPGAVRERADTAAAALLAMGSRARLRPDTPSLLPCRIHSFFRGLPGLWICMDPDCAELSPEERNGIAGRLYAQPRERCQCGSPVLEYFTCRYCGTSYARAYTNDVSNPQYIWANPGETLTTDAGLFEAYHPLDLLLEEPSAPERGRAAHYDLRAGRLNPETPSDRLRLVYLRPDADALQQEDEEAEHTGRPGEFAPCGCCRKSYAFGQSSVQDHQTKGDQPFQALLATQIRVQPPGPQPATEFAPLRGRKVLVFSDSRQVAARLAPKLQSYSLKDSIRALLPVGFQILAGNPQFGNSLVLNHAFQAIVVAAHRFGVRVRPELDAGEVMPTVDTVPTGQVPSGADLTNLLGARCPINLMRAIVEIIKDNGLGLEPLAIASIVERPSLTERITSLPSLPGLAEDSEEKLAVARAWLRCWARSSTGIWFSDMPPAWWTTEVTTHRGEFRPMERVLLSRDNRRIFSREWLPRLLPLFTQRLSDGGTRLLATNLSLAIGGDWRRCQTCKSVHRPIAALTTCIDCGAATIEAFDPAADPVFVARRGFYREPVQQALTQPEPNFISLIAAEHTAQLNAAQPEDAFSQAENHEIRFQDVNLAWRDTDAHESAIDVLSSTTTMEVGIDIGELSGVSLRNMPPGRANYQQRAGRAGRRGTAVATVVAFGSSDSHDDHYFVSPDEMIRGPVTDPRLTLENPDIARRHLRAYLLQRYHQDRIPGVDPQADPSLFSVLGRIRDFRDGTGVLNRGDFRQWLADNSVELEASANRWLPHELSAEDRSMLVREMSEDVLRAVDDAIGNTGADDLGTDADAPTVGDGEHSGDASEAEGFVDPADDKLLDRLLYWGVLPRYAFPTDVAPFYVFNRALSTAHRPKMEFAPTQGLNIALSQYAPNKQVWIKGKQYTSKAIYSPYRDERREAWGRRKLYFECSRCGHARTEDYTDARRGVVLDCEACRASDTFGPSRPWLRPPGFAHPIDREPVSTQDTPIETAYATRAKLVMQTPGPDHGWVHVNERIRGFPTREHLLVSNTGPNSDGYHYCTSCGRIEAVADPEMILFQAHSRPYRSDEDEPCAGNMVATRIVLGTDFRTDVALFSLPVEEPFRLRPGNDETASALRTVCEAVAKAACRILEIESGEILAEYRPALTAAGAVGLEAEIFIYDTLSGGAGFSPQLVGRGQQLFEQALRILGECPEGCDASCYRCLRSFRNKLEHRLLDRRLGEQLLRHVLFGRYPAYSAERIEASLRLLFDDLVRQFSTAFRLERNAVRRTTQGRSITVPILAQRLSTSEETWISLSSPIAPDVSIDVNLRGLQGDDEARHLCVDDLLVRRHLPAAISRIQGALR